MALTLRIMNQPSLPGGEPIEYHEAGHAGFDIGRNPFLQWVLPDPSRIVSGKHCEVRYQDGAYWLYDVSTNGTFVNGGEGRITEPHRLKTGDKIEIGPYLIGVTVDADRPGASDRPADVGPSPAPKNGGDNIWQLDDMLGADGRRTSPRPASPGASPAGDDGPAEIGAPLTAKGVGSVWPSVPNQTAAQEAETDPTDRGAYQRPWPGTPTEQRTPTRNLDDVYDHVMAAISDAISPPIEATAEGPAEDAAEAAESFVERLARSAGVPPRVFAKYSPEELADELGTMLRATCEGLSRLLAARTEAKGIVRSASQTTIRPAENNPLKFSPTVEEALRMLFARNGHYYLGPTRTVTDSVEDLQAHQLLTYAAMQRAALRLIEDVDPKAFAAKTGEKGTVGGLMSSRKARLWDLYVSRWEGLAGRSDDEMLGVFLGYFSEAYDSGSRS